jgi:hypothetical protein
MRRESRIALTRLRSTLVLTFTTALLVALFAPSPAFAASQSLALNQGGAFAILGHSCGGIQEKAYATGFASGTGFPTGAVYLSTRCGGSGHAGGGTTLYSAWTTVTWDFKGAVVSYERASTTPEVNPTLVVKDSHENKLYNLPVAGVADGSQMYAQAYLELAPGFVPAPRVTAISATNGPTSGGTSITIRGTGFTGATAVDFGASGAASFTVNSDESITAVSPAGASGAVDVTVTTAGGPSATSSADKFTFIAPPTVTGVSPNSVPLAGGVWGVTVTGTNLATTTKVSIGDTQTSFNVISDTSLEIYIPAGESPETVDIIVTTIGGTSERTSADQFTYLPPPPPPTVTGLSPSSGTERGGTTVRITGAGFTKAQAVFFGGVLVTTFTVNNDGSITAVSPPGTGTVNVTVATPSGTSSISSADVFTYKRKK